MQTIDLLTTTILTATSKILQGEHPGYTGLSDRINNAETFLWRITTDEPERAKVMASEIRTNPQATSEASGLSPERCGWAASIIEKTLALHADQTARRALDAPPERASAADQAIYDGIAQRYFTDLAKLMDDRAAPAQAASNASDAPHNEPPRGRVIHDLREMSMGMAYDETQTSDRIKHHDFLLVKDGVAVLERAWPVMIQGTSQVFHAFQDTPEGAGLAAGHLAAYRALQQSTPKREAAAATSPAPNAGPRRPGRL